MPKKGHTEEQIVAVLRQVEAGARVEDVCRKAGISEATYSLWKRQYCGDILDRATKKWLVPFGCDVPHMLG